MEFRERADAIGAEKLVLVQHLRKNTAQPFLIDQRQYSSIAYSSMSFPRLVNEGQKFRHLFGSLLKSCGHLRNALSLPRFNDGRGAERKETHHRTDFQPGGRPVRQLQE